LGTEVIANGKNTQAQQAWQGQGQPQLRPRQLREGGHAAAEYIKLNEYHMIACNYTHCHQILHLNNQPIELNCDRPERVAFGNTARRDCLCLGSLKPWRPQAFRRSQICN
jgi:hypothetical protein